MYLGPPRLRVVANSNLASPSDAHALKLLATLKRMTFAAANCGLQEGNMGPTPVQVPREGFLNREVILDEITYNHDQGKTTPETVEISALA